MEEDEEDKKSASRQQQGIYCKKANANIFSNIYGYPYEDKNLCINFARIDDISSNNIITFVSFIKRQFCAHKRNVYLLNLHRDIFNKMYLGEKISMLKEDVNMVSIMLGTSRRVLTYSELTKKSMEIFENKLTKSIIDCTVDLTHDDEQHTSVPVYLSKYINVKDLAESNPRFFRFGVYCLGMKLIEQNILSQDYTRNVDMCLFFHTMNGGFISTQLAQLFNIDMIYLDHLGPMENVHRKHFEKSIWDNKNYVIVSDVICLGGEVGRARTIIEYFGGKVSAELCVVDIKTIYRRPKNRISLYTISKEQNLIGYQIKTDLCDICEKENGCDK